MPTLFFTKSHGFWGLSATGLASSPGRGGGGGGWGGTLKNFG